MQKGQKLERALLNVWTVDVPPGVVPSSIDLPGARQTLRRSSCPVAPLIRFVGRFIDGLNE